MDASPANVGLSFPGLHRRHSRVFLSDTEVQQGVPSAAWRVRSEISMVQTVIAGRRNFVIGDPPD